MLYQQFVHNLPSLSPETSPWRLPPSPPYVPCSRLPENQGEGKKQPPFPAFSRMKHPWPNTIGTNPMHPTGPYSPPPAEPIPIIPGAGWKNVDNLEGFSYANGIGKAAGQTGPRNHTQDSDRRPFKTVGKHRPAEPNHSNHMEQTNPYTRMLQSNSNPCTPQRNLYPHMSQPNPYTRMKHPNPHHLQPAGVAEAMGYGRMGSPFSRFSQKAPAPP